MFQEKKPRSRYFKKRIINHVCPTDYIKCLAVISTLLLKIAHKKETLRLIFDQSHNALCVMWLQIGPAKEETIGAAAST